MQVVGIVATGVMTLVLVRLLGPHSYGVYALALSVGGVVLLPVDAGVTMATGRLLSAARRRREGAQIVRTGLAVKLTIGVVASSVLAAVAPAIADAYGDSGLAWPIRLVAGVVLTQSVFGFAIGCFTAVRMTMNGLFIVTVESIGEAIIVIAATAAGAGAAGAIGGRLAAYGLAAALGVALLDRRFRLLRRAARVRRDVVRTILEYGFALALVDAAWALFVQIDVILIAAILDSTAAGEFQAPVRLLGLVAYPGLALATAFGPRVNVDDAASLLRRFRNSLRLLLSVGMLAGIAALTVAPALIHEFLGPKYADAASVTRALAPWMLLAGLTPDRIEHAGLPRPRAAAAAVRRRCGRHQRRHRRDSAATHRGRGSSVGTDAGMAVFTLGALWLCARALELRRPEFLHDARCVVLPGAVGARDHGAGRLGDGRDCLLSVARAATAAVGAIVARREEGSRLARLLPW